LSSPPAPIPSQNNPVHISASYLSLSKIHALIFGVSSLISIGRPRRRWVDNIRMDLGEVGWDDVDWIGVAQDRNRWGALVNSVLNLRVP
jgi:hypothetical protein